MWVSVEKVPKVEKVEEGWGAVQEVGKEGKVGEVWGETVVAAEATDSVKVGVVIVVSLETEEVEVEAADSTHLDLLRFDCCQFG